MSNNNSIKRKEFRQLKDSSFYYEEESLPEVEKEINELLEELDKEMAENKKVIAEIDRVLLERMSYEELKEQANLVRLRLGFDLL